MTAKSTNKKLKTHFDIIYRAVMLARDEYDSAVRQDRDDNYDDRLVIATRRYKNALDHAVRISQLFHADEASDVARQNEINDIKERFDNRNSADAMYDGGRSKTQGRRIAMRSS